MYNYIPLFLSMFTAKTKWRVVKMFPGWGAERAPRREEVGVVTRGHTGTLVLMEVFCVFISLLDT